jgi:hypothetical protein
MSLAGVNFIHLAFGMIGQLLTSSYEQAVIDNEIFTAAFELTRGIEVNKETCVNQIGLARDKVLTHACTLKNYRRHQRQPPTARSVDQGKGLWRQGRPCQRNGHKILGSPPRPSQRPSWTAWRSPFSSRRSGPASFWCRTQ